VNAFFRWEFNSCETIVRDGEVYPIDYANASPDVSLISLHFYFPWAITTLLKWCAFCVVTGRPMRVAMDPEPYFAVEGTYEERLEQFRLLADADFQLEDYEAFCADALPGFDERAAEWFAGEAFDRLLVETMRASFPPHEHEDMVAHYRGLLAPA
jgi:hypothetical protein